MIGDEYSKLVLLILTDEIENANSFEMLFTEIMLNNNLDSNDSIVIERGTKQEKRKKLVKVIIEWRFKFKTMLRM